MLWHCGCIRRATGCRHWDHDRMKAKEETQISVFLSNRPGVVADFCKALTDAQVSIRAMTVLDTVDIGTMRIVVDDVERAAEALKGSAVAYVLVPVVSLQIANKPGAFAALARTMANAGVNIEYCYATVLPQVDRSLGIFRVSDVDTALKLDFLD